MTKILLFFIGLTLFGCQYNEPTDTTELQSNLSYFKDHRTNLCFAALNSQSSNGYMVTSITCVPCDSVKKFLK